MKQKLKDDWQDIFSRIFKELSPSSEGSRIQEMDFDLAMKKKYGLKVNGACHGHVHLLPEEGGGGEGTSTL